MLKAIRNSKRKAAELRSGQRRDIRDQENIVTVEWTAAKRLTRREAQCKRYKITMDDYERMLQEQGGKCAICQEKDPAFIDHCHRLGHVRGLLCGRCNTLLGMAKDRPDFLQRAIEYLERNHVYEDELPQLVAT